METFTYVMWDHSFGVKIGKSIRPLDRLKALQAANPRPLVLVGTVAGDYESHAHDHFRDQLIHGEWFAVDPWEALENIVQTAQNELRIPKELATVRFYQYRYERLKEQPPPIEVSVHVIEAIDALDHHYAGDRVY